MLNKKLGENSMKTATCCLFVALVGAVVGCGNWPDPISDSAIVDVQFAIQCGVEPRQIGFGDSVEIDLRITNVTSRTVTKHYSSGCLYGYTIYDEHGQAVAVFPEGCLRGMSTVEYARGVTVDRTFHWSWDDESIEPGTYFVDAGFGQGGRLESGRPVEILLR